MASSSEQEIAECTDSRVDDCTIHCVSSDCDGQVINAADKDSLTVICQDSFTEDGCADLDVELEVGISMRMVFRVKDYDVLRGFRRYFWKATPQNDTH